MTKGVKKMKRMFLVSLMAILAVMTLSLVSADSLDVTDVTISVDDFLIGNPSETEFTGISVEGGDTISIEVFFTSEENASDVEISTWVEGERSNAVEKGFADLIDGKQYHARMALTFPDDLDEREEDLSIFVRIETDEGSFEREVILNVQRKPHRTEILFVESEQSIRAGEVLPIDVVVKNLGRHELEDTIVTAVIPELGISKRAYFGDLVAVDDCDDDCDDEDARERTLYLKIPENVKSGFYELVIEARSDDASDLVRKSVQITSAKEATKVIVPVSSKTVNLDEVITYDLVIVNSGNEVAVYELIPEEDAGVIVSVEESIVTVTAGNSKTVEVKVRGIEEGTQSFAVNVNSDGQLVQRAGMTANVEQQQIRSGVALLTIILALIFIVLLVVLIVLLTRKPSRTEELEESYY